MFKPLPLFLGLRYTRAQRRNHFISFIALTSMLGVALGIAALIVVLSVMNGFQKELRERILGMASHATIAGPGGVLRDWQTVSLAAAKHPEVVATAPYVEGQVMLTAAGIVSGALLRGIAPDAEPGVADKLATLKQGQLTDLKPGTFGIVLGAELAYALGVGVGDKVTLVTPQANVTPAGILPRLKRFDVVGIFEVGMFEYDRNLALIHLQDAQTLLRLEDAISGVRLKLKDLFLAPQISRELTADLSGSYVVSDWTRRHANFFRAVKIEKRMMFIILSLIVAVAAFNIVSTLVMTVTDKQADIAILRTLGLTAPEIMLIFIIHGAIIGGIGAILGLVGGVSIALNIETLVPAIEQLFNVEFLDSSVYYISDLPSDLQWGDVWQICLTAFSLTLLATLYPAWRAARTQPAEALRYE
jgi:lipoprotein-releasing system permease protein